MFPVGWEGHGPQGQLLGKRQKQAKHLAGSTSWGTLSHCQPWGLRAVTWDIRTIRGQQETCPLGPTYPTIRYQFESALSGRIAAMGPQRPLEEV